MNVVFAGYRSWAYSILKNLLNHKTDNWTIAAAITTTPESPFNKLSLPLIAANPVELEKIISKIDSFSPKVLLFYGWSWIIPSSVYKKFNCLILHTSPLPKYRGGSPLQHQIMTGEKQSAISIFKADGGLDTGDIYGQHPFSLEGSMNDIFKRIAHVGTQTTIEVLNEIASNSLKPIKQDETKATACKRRRPNESQLTIKDFENKTAEQLYNFIRSLEDPYPNAFFVCKDGKKILFKNVSLK